MAQWQSIGDVRYHKLAMYDLRWPLDREALENGMFAGAPNGGPLAYVPPLDRHGKVFSLAGELLASFDPGPRHDVVAVGWAAKDGSEGSSLVRDVLLVVTRSGEVRVYLPALGRPERPSRGRCLLHFGDQVLSCHVHKHGVVAVLSSGAVVAGQMDGSCRHLNGGRPVIVEPAREQPLCVCAANEDGVALVSTSLGRVLAVDASAARPLRVHQSQGEPDNVERMTLSPNGVLLACFLSSGWLTVNTWQDEEAKQVVEFDTESGVAPVQLCWSGGDSVVLHWRQFGLLMVGPTGDWVKYTYDEPVVLLQELDSLRILTVDALETLSRVPPSTEAVRRVGSFAPAAMLLDAVQALDTDPRSADVSLRAIKEEGTLPEAVIELIDAATAEVDVTEQQSLLKAAAVGKTWCDNEDERRECAAAFVLACNSLRVLNVVRHTSVGFPLTLHQLEDLGSRRLVSRLLDRRMHLLTLKLQVYLGLPHAVKQAVMMHWASAKIRCTETDPRPETATTSPSSTPPSPSPSAAAAAAAAAAPQRRRVPHSLPPMYTGPMSSVSVAWGPGSPALPAAAASAAGVMRSNKVSRARGDSDEPQHGAAETEERERALFETLRSKLAPVKGMRYAALARTASRAGKPVLAKLLTDAEPVSLHRALQLLQLGQLPKALAYAVHAHEPGLILFVLLAALPGAGKANPTKLDMPAYLTLISQFPLARNILADYLERSGQNNLLLRLLEQSGRLAATTRKLIHDAYLGETLAHRAGSLRAAQSRLKRLAQQPPPAQQPAQHAATFQLQRQRASFMTQVLDEQLRLLRFQEEMEALTGKARFVDNSLADTIFNLLILRLDRKAQQIKDELRASDRLFQHMKLKALAQLQEWDQLQQLSNKTSLPLLDFVEACMEAGNTRGALAYAERVTGEDRLEALLKTGQWEAAAEVAAEASDVTTLQLLRMKCQDDALKDRIAQLMRRL